MGEEVARKIVPVVWRHVGGEEANGEGVGVTRMEMTWTVNGVQRVRVHAAQVLVGNGGIALSC